MTTPQPPRLVLAPADDGALIAVEVHDPDPPAEGPGTGVATDAPLIVLAHGFPMARWLWGGVLPALAAAGWRAAAPDLRGFGESTLGGAEFRGAPTIDRYADDLARVLDALETDRAVVGGLSMGGYAALAFWRRHPDRARALVLADTRAEPDSAEARERRDALVALAHSTGGAAVADTQVEGALGRSTREEAPAPGASSRAADFRARLGAPVPEAVAAALVAMRDRPDATALLATVTVPTLVVGGVEDAITPPKTLRALAGAIPGARLALLDRAGHASAWEQPDAFASVLLDFLAGLPGADSAGPAGAAAPSP